MPADDLSVNLMTLLVLGLALFGCLGIPKPWGRTMRRVVLMSFVVVVLVGFGALVFSLISTLALGQAGYTGLTYEEYKRCVGTDGLDPVGATDICFRHDQAVDSYDTWKKLHIEPSDFASLLAHRSVDMQDPYFAAYSGKAARPIRKFASERGEIPSNWPKPMRSPPPWWDAPTERGGLQCVCWELQVSISTDRGTRRAKGWYWLYEPDTMTLWIWEWNQQHFELT